MTPLDIVTRIRKRFPRPKDAEDGLLSNEAADEIERLRAIVDTRESGMAGRQSSFLQNAAAGDVKA